MASSLQSILLGFEKTPSKVIVNHEINSWAETQLKPRQPHRKAAIPPIHRKVQQAKSDEKTCLESLKQHHRILLNSHTKQSGKVLPSTTESYTNQIAINSSSR